MLTSILSVCLMAIGAALSLRPKGNSYVRRIKRIFYVFDVSPSMQMDPYPYKLATANDAARRSIAKLREKVRGAERNDLEITAIAFSGAAWTIQTENIHAFEWEDLEVTGSGTNICAALNEVARHLTEMYSDESVLFREPAIILLTDGQQMFGPGIPETPWQEGLAKVLECELGKNCIRIGIGIGPDCDMAMLHEFQGNNPEHPPLTATNAEEIARQIELASTVLAFGGRVNPPIGSASPVSASVGLPLPDQSLTS